ncbi:MAG: OmpH family outer membrane protein [bacterium]|nr:MAG: OmpH family outer membrane protein [bacterium]
MIKRLILFGAVLFAVASVFHPGDAESASMVKIGVIDLQKALNATSEGQAAKETLRRKHQVKQDEIDAMQAELASMEEKLKSPVLSEDAQADLQQRFRRKKGELLEFVAKAREEEEKENQALSGRILDGLVGIAREIGKRDEYTIILERSSSGVVFAQDVVDLTESVVKIYNEQNKGGEGN